MKTALMTLEKADAWKPTAGIFEAIPHDEYLAAEGISHSLLRHMDPTPAHCLAYQNRPPEEPSAERLLGSLLHSSLLTPSEELPLVVKPPGMKFSTLAGKHWRAEALAAGKIILGEEDWTMVQALCRTARESSLCQTIFGAGRPEVSMWAPVEAGTPGTLLKARIDWVPEQGNALVDLKSVRDASPEGFRKAMLDYCWHSQAAWYLDVWERIGDSPRDAFCFVVFEKQPPFLVAAYQVGPASLTLGRKQNARRLERLLRCMEEDRWPGYGEEIREVEVPDWALKRE
jgi:PDDEXK-like domain of unknown function (DUF3799)